MFLVLIMGLLIACLIAICERCYHKKERPPAIKEVSLKASMAVEDKRVFFGLKVVELAGAERWLPTPHSTSAFEGCRLMH